MGLTTPLIISYLSVLYPQVNAYGFGGSYTKFSEHYYDKTFNKHVNYANHDNGAENTLWKKLDELGIINLYKRD